MLTIASVSHILTEFGIPATPFTVKRWIDEGELRGEHDGSDDSGWRISQESLNRLIRRHLRDLSEQNQLLSQQLKSVLHERENLWQQLAQARSENLRLKGLLVPSEPATSDEDELPF